MRIRSIAARSAVLAVLAITLAACVTTAEVERIVGESQSALTASFAAQDGERILLDTEIQAPAAATRSQGPDGEAWREQVAAKRDAAVGRIDAFVAAHKDTKGLVRTVNALRLRKALLLMAGGKPNQARATFQEVDTASIGNARDLAIFQAHDALVWWWAVAGKRLNPDVFEPKASKHVETIDKAIADSPEGSAIRYYLATVRAHIYLKWSSMTALQHEKLQAGLGAYAREFDSAAQANIRKFVSGDRDELLDIPTENLRWFGQARITADEYESRYQAFLDDTLSADLQDLGSELRELVQSGALAPTPQWPDDCNCRWLVDL